MNDAARTDVAFNTTSNSTISGRAASTPLTVSYDASSSSYAITGGGVTDTFAPADRQTSSVTGETKYIRRTGDVSSYLTLVTTPYYGTVSNRYVGMGYAQRNTRSGDRQDTAFTTFTYGLDTPASGVLRTGVGTFATDVLGLASFPGLEPDVFQGQGRFDVDFVNGLFSTVTLVTRIGLISGNSTVGGGFDLPGGGGGLAAANGTFTGDVVYSSSGRQIGGQLNGRFYGPNADEIGASFSGSASDGSAFNGALTGQRDATLPAVNTSFARLMTSQLFYADATTLMVSTPRTGGMPTVSAYPGQLGTAMPRSQFTDKTSGNVSFNVPISNMASGDYTVTSIVAGDPNFTSYARTIAGQSTQLQLYKTGSDNRELALTYASFGKYSTSNDSSASLYAETNRVFFVYGFNTPSGLLANRSGTASYAGVAYGVSADAKGTFYDVTGTAKMSVDFGAQSLSGNLALAGSNSDEDRLRRVRFCRKAH